MPLPHLGFRHKILLLVGASVAALVLMATLGVHRIAQLIEGGRRDSLVAAVEIAHSTVMALHEQARSGKLPREQAQAQALRALREARYADGDYFYIWTLDGTNVMLPPKPQWEGQNKAGQINDGLGGDLITRMAEAVRRTPGGAFVEVRFPKAGQTEPLPKLQYLKLVPDWNWMVGSGLYMDDVLAVQRRTALEAAVVGLAVIVLLGALGTWIARSVIGEIGGEPAAASAAMRAMAQGRLDLKLPPSPRGSLMAHVGEMAEALRHTVRQVRHGTDGVDGSVTEIAAGNVDLSTRTEQVAAQLERTSSAMRQVLAAVERTTQVARDAESQASEAAAVAGRSGQAVGELVQALESLNASSERMASIVGTIDALAFQTNILALNAAVEAARAGEQGRGFAVVAAEVRTLAQRSATAAREIKTLIQSSVERVEDGSQRAGQAGRQMQALIESAQRVSTLVAGIASSATGEREELAQIGQAVALLDDSTQRNAALVEQATAAVMSLREQSGQLAASVRRFELGEETAAA